MAKSKTPASHCNPASNLPTWNLRVPGQAPTRYSAYGRPGNVISPAHFGTQIGNNQIVAYDGREVFKFTDPASLTRTYLKMSTHSVREIAKGQLITYPDYMLDSTLAHAELLRQVAAGLPASHPVAKLTTQHFVDLLSVASLSQIQDAIRTMKNRDGDVEVKAQQTWWLARGIKADAAPASQRNAYDTYAARLYATALQTSAALGVRTNELQQTRLAARCAAVGPRIAAVHLNARDIPTTTRAARADATAVLAAV